MSQENTSPIASESLCAFDLANFDPKLQSSYLFYLQFNGFPDTKQQLFPYTGLHSIDSYYYCQTGLSKNIYHSRLGISGKTYHDLYFDQLHMELTNLLHQHCFHGTPYLILDDSKHIGLIFQPSEQSTLSPLALAQKIDQLVQQQYRIVFPSGTGRYCNTTTLSTCLHGLDGFYEGHRETSHLKRLSFFHMTPGVFTTQLLKQMCNHADYRTIMGQCRQACISLGRGQLSAGFTQIEHLFLHLLKYSFNFELTRNVLSYIKEFLNIRLTVYQQLHDIDLNHLCNLESYKTIEECLESLLPVFHHLTPTDIPLAGCSDLVAYSAYYIHRHLSEDIALQEIAAYTDTTPSYLSNAFHQQTGMTIKQYQAQIRMEKACDLLSHTDKKIGEIAQLTGFSDRRYFTAMFKAQIGMTPQQYRQSKLDGSISSPT